MILSPSRLEEILAKFAQLKVLVLGDLMLDEFIWGKVSRISPEAPVPVVEVQTTSLFPGGAANVARNLREFAAGVAVCGVVGEDDSARKLRGLLQEEGIGTEGVLALASRCTTHKTRVSAQLQQTSREVRSHEEAEKMPVWSYAQIVRVDQETRQPLCETERQQLLDYLARAVPEYDAVIIEDYAKGVLDQKLVSGVVGEAREHGKILAVDPNPSNPLMWNGVTVVKPNRSETFQAAGLAAQSGMDSVLKAAHILQKRWESQYLLVTLGADGMLLLEQEKPHHHAPTKAREVYDVSGAGDTAISLFTLALAAGATGIEAAEISNHASGVVVGKLGTATLTQAELRASFAAEWA
jgi:D-glycero-beta-D-manno-heptose-7-phosphate kinase